MIKIEIRRQQQFRTIYQTFWFLELNVDSNPDDVKLFLFSWTRILAGEFILRLPWRRETHYPNTEFSGGSLHTSGGNSSNLSLRFLFQSGHRSSKWNSCPPQWASSENSLQGNTNGSLPFLDILRCPSEVATNPWSFLYIRIKDVLTQRRLHLHFTLIWRGWTKVVSALRLFVLHNISK